MRLNFLENPKIPSTRFCNGWPGFPSTLSAPGSAVEGMLDEEEKTKLLDRAANVTLIRLYPNNLSQASVNAIMHIGSLLPEVTHLVVNILNDSSPSQIPFDSLLALNAFSSVKKVTFINLGDPFNRNPAQVYSLEQLKPLAKAFRNGQEIVFDRALCDYGEDGSVEAFQSSLRESADEELTPEEQAILNKALTFGLPQPESSAPITSKPRPIVGGVVIGVGVATALGGGSLFLPMVSTAIADPLLTIIVGTLVAVAGVGAITVGAMKTHATLTGTSLKALFNHSHPKGLPLPGIEIKGGES